MKKAPATAMKGKTIKAMKAMKASSGKMTASGAYSAVAEAKGLKSKDVRAVAEAYMALAAAQLKKAGKFKFEASSDKLHKDLKIDVKSDLMDPSKITVAATYSGVKDAQFKIEHKAAAPQDFNGEMTYSLGMATCGIKFTSALLSGSLPDFGVRVQEGPFFGSLTAKEKFQTYNAHLFYKATPDVKCACTYQHGGKASGAMTFGLVYKNLYKMKVSQDQSVACSVKHTVSKGFTVLGGAKYNIKKGDYSYGLQLSVE